MPLPEYPLDERRTRALVALYNNTRTEITRYRDYGWRITSYVLALLGGCIALGLNSQFRPIWNSNPFLKGVFLSLVGLASLIGIGFIWIAHMKYIEHRKLRHTLDLRLGFCDKGMFGNEGALLAAARITGARSIHYPLVFTALIVTVAVIVVGVL